MKHIIKVEVLENLPKTRPLIAMDPEGNLVCKQDGTKIWYTTTDGEIYDLGGIIETLVSAGATYNGPAVVSNEYDEEKQMWCMTFDDNVTILGDLNFETMTAEGPFFGTDQESGITCNVETIILSKTTTRIGDYTFGGCAGLTSIEIPNSVITIGDGAFLGCIGLTSVTIPNSVTNIGSDAFYTCSSLTAIKIPNSVTSIGDYAFDGCSGLTSVIIGNNVTSIGDYAFRGCSGLSSVICETETPPTLAGPSVFVDTNGCPIYVPSQSVETYKAAENWSAYADRIVCLLNNNQIRYIANEQLTIHSGVDYTNHTFNNGVGLVTFTNNLITLESNWLIITFDNYDNIKTLTLPNGVSTIRMACLSGVNRVYYEGTQKECARIDKSWLDGTGTEEYQCFDGIVSDYYNSNMVSPLVLAREASWFVELIGKKIYGNFLSIVGSVKIDENPMTAGEFISTLVNGVDGNPGLSAYRFTVINQDIKGVTIPLAYYTESEHFIGIVKATDYAHIDLEHIVPVAVDEALDPDYMYILLDDTTIIANVTIEHENGSSETIRPNREKTYSANGYEGYYRQNIYDSGIGETPEQFLVDNYYPEDGETIYDYCNDMAEDEHEASDEP